MDTSETYIKMCEKAEEIQSRQPNFMQEDKEFRHISETGDYTWLPRQDQLQEIVNENMNHVVKQLGITNCLHFKDLTQMLTMSWEQLWLAFVMKEKYNKVWNGEDWIDAKLSASEKK